MYFVVRRAELKRVVTAQNTNRIPFSPEKRNRVNV